MIVGFVTGMTDRARRRRFRDAIEFQVGQEAKSRKGGPVYGVFAE